jgi:hypothetical protein
VARSRAPGLTWPAPKVLRFNFSSGLVSITGNVVFMSIFVGQLGLHYLVGNLASVASCALLNFLVSDRLVFLALESGPQDAGKSVHMVMAVDVAGCATDGFREARELGPELLPDVARTRLPSAGPLARPAR